MYTSSVTKQLHTLANQCIQLSQNTRPELIKLQEYHRQLQNACHLNSKIDTDRLLYERMYGRSPEKTSSLLKLRYWRTGRAVPGNRKQCLLLGQALELSDAQLSWLIQAYYDRSLSVYLTEKQLKSPEYQERSAHMLELSRAYLEKVPSERLIQLQILPERIQHYLRHLYFTDAFNYIQNKNIPQKLLRKHITSTRYDSEFTRQMKLLGEIPRKTMIRHILILRLPDITLEKMNEELQFFGYLPLTEDHTLVHGERMDWLLIHLLQLYESQCKEDPDTEKLLWFQKACRTLDSYFIRTRHPELRFMYFKALEL
ncbi:hypothetical protein JQM69_08155 [Faecalicatena contorta]|uniref:hypothetical protein n=1 Tax=Faecalicatena contorta TaxID=39482 RepID=UPI001F1AC2E3|nr:hypothetical protein [Faecalicatena contorta]MCF2680663.1 hypothetical protein [Faecalicatena contorta]